MTDDETEFTFDVAEPDPDGDDQEGTVDEENESADDQESGILLVAKAKVFAVVAWLRAEFDQALEEIAPQLRGAFSGVSIPSRAIKPVGLAAVLLVAAVAVPAADLGGSDSTAIETDEEPVEGTTYDGSSESTSYEAPGDADYRRVVESAVGTAEPDAPDPPSEVQASAGTQTMNIETTVVDGEPALVLEDDRTHSGRWVTVPTSWFDEAVGEVPNAARIEHDSGETYAAPLVVRGESAAFYVKEFSTNTVTFSGEVTLSGTEADDGTQYQYELNTTNVDDPSINLTGVETAQSASTSAVQSGTGSTSFTVGGTTAPTNEEVTLTGTRQTATDSRSYTSTGGTSETVAIGGNTAPESESISVTGYRSENARSKSYSRVDSTSDSINVGGNVDPTATVSVAGLDVTVAPSYTDHSSDGLKAYAYIPDAVGTFSLNGHNVDAYTNSGQGGVRSYLYIADGDVGENVFTDGYQIDDDYSSNEYIDSGSGNYYYSFSGSHDVSGTNGITLGFKFGGSGDPRIEQSGSAKTNYQTTPDHTISSGGDSFTATSDGDYDLALSTGSETIDVSGASGSDPVNVDVSWTEVTETRDPQLTQGGSTVWSYSGTLADGETVTENIDLSQETSDLAFSTAGNADVDVSWTEVTETQDPSVTVAGSTVSHSGTLADGETVTESVDLSTGDETASISTGGKVGVDIGWTERTETRDPAVTVNGETSSHSGSLAEGSTTSLSINSSALKNGTNTVEISTNSPTNGPASLVTFDYSHGAERTTTATVNETTWSTEATASRTWESEQSNATAVVPMNERVVAVRNVEIRYNGTTWDSLSPSEYRMNGTDIVVDLGTVRAGTTTDLRATGSKVRVENGSITVLEGTSSSSGALDTRVRVDEAGSNFALRVDSTEFSDRVHYAENATFETAGETVITAEGSQTVTLPNAAPGDEATVRTWPIEISATRDSVTIPQLTGERSEPGITVRGNGYADVDYTFVDAKDAKPYILYSTTKEVVRDQGLASSPITLTDDNSDETLVFRVDDGTASGSGSGSNSAVGGAPMETAQEGFSAFRGLLPSNPLYVLLGLLGLSAGVVAVRRSGVVAEGTRGGAAVDIGQEVARTAGGLVERLLENELVVGALVLAGGAWVLTSGVLSEEATLIVSLAAVPVALFLALQQFNRFDMRIWLGSTALVAVFGLQALAPELGATIVEEAGVILAVGGLLIAWRVVSAFRAEAETPDEVTRVELETEDND